MSSKPSTYTPRISVDFDGVIHSYTSEWKGDQVIPDPPVPGAFEFIASLMDNGYAVAIFSTRSKSNDGVKAMKAWLISNDMPSDMVGKIEFPKDKPAAIINIDDRCFHFTGTFPTVEYIKNFKPWNKE